MSTRLSGTPAALLAAVLTLACDSDPTGSGLAGSAATSTVTAAGVAVMSGASLEVDLVVKDAAGQPVGRGGDLVVFGLSGGTSTARVSGAVDRGDGTYSATVVGDQAGSPMAVTATLNGDSVTTTPPTVAVVAGTASPATSLVSVASATLDVGSASAIRLETYDAAGNRVVAGGVTVTFGDSGGTSVGTFGAVTDHGDGSYTADYTGEAVGTEVTVLTTMNQQRVTTPAPTLAVTAGPPSATTSELESSSDSITVGGAATLTLRTRDANGALLSLGGRSVAFSVLSGAGTSDGVIETDSVDLGDGTYTARFRGTAEGGPVAISASIDDQPITSPLPTVVVVAVAVSPQTSIVTLTDSLTTAGDTTEMTLQVRDISGNDLARSGLSVAFSIDSTGGGSWGLTDTIPVRDNGDGTYTGWLVARVSGPAAPVGGTIDGTAVEMLDSLGVSQLPRLRVVPDSVSIDSSSVTIDDSALDLGQTTTVRLTSRDRWGNQLGAGGLSVEFPLVGMAGPYDSADVGSTVDLGDGRYTAPVTATIDGAQPNWIRPTINTVPLLDSVSVSVVCAAGPVDLGQSSTAVDGLVNGDEIPSGIPITVRFTARDAAGNCLLASGLSVAFSAAGGTSTGSIGTPIDNQDGTYSSTFIGAIAGSATTISTTVGGSPVTSAPPTITVTPGDVSAATSVVSVGDTLVDPGTVVQLLVQTRDAAGNDITNDTLGLAVILGTSGGTSGGTVGGTGSNDDGTYQAQFTAATPGTPLTVGATIDGTPISTPLPTVEVDTVAPALSVVTINGGSATTLVAGDSTILLLRAKDDQGRDIRGAGKSVVFGVGGGAGSSSGSVGITADLGDGTYAATVVGTTAGSAAPITASIDGVPVSSSLPTLTVVPGPVSLNASTVSVSDSVVAVGATVTITLVARDAFANQQTAGGLTVLFALAGGTSDGTFTAVSDNGDGTYQGDFQGVTAGGPTSVTATIDGSPVTTPLPTVRVQ